MNITAPVAAVLWFQFWQYYLSTDTRLSDGKWRLGSRSLLLPRVVFAALINAKSRRKAETNTAEFADWAGAISGKLGQRTENGFEVVDAGLQIFEKKAKEPKPEEGAAVAEAGAS